MSFVAGLVGFFIGNLVTGCSGGIIGMFVCMVPAMIGGYVFIGSINARRKAEAQAKAQQ